MRLFAAVRPEGLSREVLEQVLGALRRQGRGTFPHPAALHLTLAFLGETERVDAARSALETLALSGRFSLTAEGLGRFGDTEKELAGAVLFLLNNEAASFITGVCIPIDGGFSAYSGV